MKAISTNVNILFKKGLLFTQRIKGHFNH